MIAHVLAYAGCMRMLRRVHTYLGVFFAPLLLFFVLSGWYQTVYRDRLKSPGDAETWQQYMRVVHTDDIYPTNREFSYPSSPKLFQFLVAVMATALTTTIILGIILAKRSLRNRWINVVKVTALGVVVPAACLWLGIIIDAIAWAGQQEVDGQDARWGRDETVEAEKLPTPAFDPARKPFEGQLTRRGS